MAITGQALLEHIGTEVARDSNQSLLAQERGLSPLAQHFGPAAGVVAPELDYSQNGPSFGLA